MARIRKRAPSVIHRHSANWQSVARAVLPIICAVLLLAGCATNSRRCCTRASRACCQQACLTNIGLPSARLVVDRAGSSATANKVVQQAAYQPTESTSTPDANAPRMPVATQPEQLPATTWSNAEPLSFDQAVELCLMNDLRLRAGFQSIIQANAGAVTASLKPNPLFWTDGQLLQLAKDFTPTRQGGPPQQDFQLGLPVDWFLFGKRAAAMASASQAIRVSRAEYENLIRERVTKAALAYYDVLEADKLLTLALQDVQTLEGIAANTQKAVDAGGRAQVELNRIRLTLIISRRTLRDAEAASATARSRLNALVGGALTNRPFVPVADFDEPIRHEIPSADEVFVIAVQNRPDLIALRWKVEQARANVLLEDRKGYPEVTTTFGYTRQYQLHTIGFPDADSWSAALTMPLPIFDRNQGNRMGARSSETQSQFELEAGELELWSEVESILAELAAARDNASAVSEQELQLAQQVLESVRQAYAIGGRTLLDLLDAQKNYRETYRAFATTRANYWRARIKYQSAIGQQNIP
jgi:cobalt-zinc-cadmium efflux system outer membrane protein